MKSFYTSHSALLSHAELWFAFLCNQGIILPSCAIGIEFPNRKLDVNASQVVFTTGKLRDNLYSFLMNGLQLFQVCMIFALKTTNLMPEHYSSQQLPSHNPSIEERNHTYHLGPHHGVCLWLEKEHHFTLNHEELTSRLATIKSC